MTKKVEHKRETEQQKNIYLSVTQTEKNWAKNATEMPLAQQNTKAELCKANWEKQLPECHRKHPCQILLWTFCWALFCFSWFYAHPGAGAAVRRQHFCFKVMGAASCHTSFMWCMPDSNLYYTWLSFVILACFFMFWGQLEPSLQSPSNYTQLYSDCLLFVTYSLVCTKPCVI